MISQVFTKNTDTNGKAMIDFHNHTSLCGHADGEPEEYIENAIKNNIKIFGFSDHAPLPEDMRIDVTMAPNETEKYINRIISLKEKYKEKIDIKIGFEVDFPLHDTFNKDYFDDERLDYFIGSCHFLEKWPIDHHKSIPDYEKIGIDTIYQKYYETILTMVESGLFHIVGHLDLPKKYGFFPKNDFKDILVQIAKKAAGNNTAIEINTAGLRKPVKEIYPSEKIIELLIENKAPITLGSDSHSPLDAGKDIDTAINILKKYSCRKIYAFSEKKPIIIEI